MTKNILGEDDSKFILDHYLKQYNQYGYSPKSLGWMNGRHNLRYKILLSHWDLKGNSILDFGCGFGDMYGFCKKNGYQTNYEGVDLNPELIKAGHKIYPDAHLWSGDVFKDGLKKKYDLIVSSGVHNLKVKDTWAFIEATFSLFNRYASVGFALNFLSNKVEYELDHTFHADPAKILDLAYQFSNRVILRNDYMPYEFSVFVDKRNNFDKKYVVYPEYTDLVK